MNPEQQSETHTEPVAERPAERPAGAAPSEGNRRRPTRGRSRFRRDGRGPRSGGDAPDQGARREQPPRSPDGHPAPQHAHVPSNRRPSGGIARAIELVEKIRFELQKVLEDINQVSQTIDLIEREREASEEEIEMLKESLYTLQRNAGVRNLHSGPPPKVATPAPVAQPEPEAPAEEDAPAHTEE